MCFYALLSASWSAPSPLCSAAVPLSIPFTPSFLPVSPSVDTLRHTQTKRKTRRQGGQRNGGESSREIKGKVQQSDDDAEAMTIGERERERRPQFEEEIAVRGYFILLQTKQVVSMVLITTTKSFFFRGEGGGGGSLFFFSSTPHSPLLPFLHLCVASLSLM